MNILLSIFYPKDYTNLDAKDRQYLLSFHKFAKKRNMDIEKYNKLRDQIAQVRTPFLVSVLSWGGPSHAAYPLDNK